MSETKGETHQISQSTQKRNTEESMLHVILFHVVLMNKLQ